MKNIIFCISLLSSYFFVYSQSNTDFFPKKVGSVWEYTFFDLVKFKSVGYVEAKKRIELCTIDANGIELIVRDSGKYDTTGGDPSDAFNEYIRDYSVSIKYDSLTKMIKITKCFHDSIKNSYRKTVSNLEEYFATNYFNPKYYRISEVSTNNEVITYAYCDYQFSKGRNTSLYAKGIGLLYRFHDINPSVNGPGDILKYSLTKFNGNPINVDSLLSIKDITSLVGKSSLNLLLSDKKIYFDKEKLKFIGIDPKMIQTILLITIAGKTIPCSFVYENMNIKLTNTIAPGIYVVKLHLTDSRMLIQKIIK